MRNFLALAFAFTLSAVAIGSPPEPDRQILDEMTIVDQLGFDQAYSAEITITTTPSFEKTFLITGQEAVALDHAIDLTFPDGITVDPITVSRDLGELVIEESPKPRDRYRLPIWEYEPSIEPPSVSIS